MTPAEVLSKARDVLAERGWHQGWYTAEPAVPTAPVCLIGAMRVAWGGSPLNHPFGAPAYDAALNAVMTVTTGKPHNWNDEHARTYEDVILALKHAEELAVPA